MGAPKTIAILIGYDRVVVTYDIMVDENLAVIKVSLPNMKLQFFIVCHRDYNEFVVKRNFDFLKNTNFLELIDDQLSDTEQKVCHLLFSSLLVFSA